MAWSLETKRLKPTNDVAENRGSILSKVQGRKCSSRKPARYRLLSWVHAKLELRLEGQRWLRVSLPRAAKRGLSRAPHFSVLHALDFL